MNSNNYRRRYQDTHRFYEYHGRRIICIFMQNTRQSIGLNTNYNNRGHKQMKFLDSLAPHVHWLIRLSLAGTFIAHGIPKFPPDGLVAMGMPLIVGWAVAFGEVGAGIALIAGAFTDERLTRLGGLLVVVIMIGAISLVHFKNGWYVQNSGMEFQALMLAAGMYFLTKGNKV